MSNYNDNLSKQELLSKPWKNQGRREGLHTTDTQHIDETISEFRAKQFILRTEEARQWMEEILDTNIDTSQKDFIDQLRDGRLLCELINKFLKKEDAIKKVHVTAKDDTMAFAKATDNIANFFQALRKIRFPDLFWFDFSDLWNRKNITTVVRCIHALAHFLDRNKYLKPGQQIRTLNEKLVRFRPEEVKKISEELSQIEKSGQQLHLEISKPPEKPKPDLPMFPLKKMELPKDDLLDEFGEDEIQMVDPKMCSIEGRGARTAVCGNETFFTIITADSDGNSINIGGENFICTLKGEGVEVPVKVEDNHDGTYTVSYVVTKSGNYVMNITLDGEQVAGAPLKIKAVDAGVAHEFRLISPPPTQLYAGKPFSLKVQAFDKYGNKRMTGGDSCEPRLVYLARDGTEKEAPKNCIEIIDLNDGTYNIICTPPYFGDFKFLIKNGKFKSFQIKVVQESIPTLEITFEKFDKGQSVIQFKCREQVLGKIKNRWVSCILPNPSAHPLTEDLKNQIKTQFEKVHWMRWIREYAEEMRKTLDPDKNTWGDIDKRCEELLNYLPHSIPFFRNNLEFVTISSEYMDWTELENEKRKKFKPQPPPPKRNRQTPMINPNDQGIYPRREAVDFWVYLSRLILQAKQKPAYATDPDNNFLLYQDKDIEVNEVKKVDIFNAPRKRDIVLYGKKLISVTKRMIFEVLHELESSVPNFILVKEKTQNVARATFNGLKGIDEMFMKQMSIGHPMNVEVDPNTLELGKFNIKQLKRQLLSVIRIMNLEIHNILLSDLGMSNEQLEDLILNSKTFKLAISELVDPFRSASAREASSKERKILVYEIPFKDQYSEISFSFNVRIPINSRFDGQCFKENSNISSLDRRSPGLVNPWKCAYVKFKKVIFEGISSGSLPPNDIKDRHLRNSIALDNAVILLKTLAANHCKRFTRIELYSLLEKKEPLLIPVTCVSLLSPFFLGTAREDRQAMEHRMAITQAINQQLVKSVKIDLYDGRQPMEIPVEFRDFVFVNIGTNVVMKTFRMGYGIQRCINGSNIGMRKFERMVHKFLRDIGERKRELRKEMSMFIQTYLSRDREGKLYEQAFSKLLFDAEVYYNQMMEIIAQNEKKVLIIDMEMEHKQRELERILMEEWYPNSEEFTTIEFLYQRKLRSLVNGIISKHYKIYEMDLKWMEKMETLVEIENKFVVQFASILKIMNIKPEGYDELYELSLLEKDLFELYYDLRDLYHKKEHERFEQAITEATDIKEIDPYAIPVRMCLLAFHMGHQVHINCKSGKDRTGMLLEQCCEFAELHAIYGSYPRAREEKKKYTTHRRNIQTSLALNGPTLEITRINSGIPGVKIPSYMAGRFIQSYFQKYVGLHSFVKLSHANRDEWFHKS